MKIYITKYLKKIFENFLEIIKTTQDSPVAEYRFTDHKDNNQKILTKEQAQKLHYAVTQLLFLCMMACPDIQRAVYFLAKGVQKSDKDDWGKLKRVLQYPKGTMYRTWVLSMDNLSNHHSMVGGYIIWCPQ